MWYGNYIIGFIIVAFYIVSWWWWWRRGYKNGHKDGFIDGVTNCKAAVGLKKITNLEAGLWITAQKIARDYIAEIKGDNIN